MKKIVNCVMKVTEEIMWNIARQQSLAAVHTHTHTHTHTSNLIEEIRVVDDCSICSGMNRLLLNRLKDVLGKGLFCVCERKI